ncbi:Phosphoribosyl transferase domain protein [uncultured archaeon]|nr:Phosphoribosyl transferase domain protein [uncultured archaeon]
MVMTSTLSMPKKVRKIGSEHRKDSPLERFDPNTADPEYTGNYSRFEYIETFKDWVRVCKKGASPMAVRTRLYDLIQPLFDVLVNKGLSTTQRKAAWTAYDSAVKRAPAILADIYLGDFTEDRFRELVEEVSPAVSELENVRYHRKERNMDGALSINQVLKFFRRLSTDYGIYSLPTPDYFIGCACGASEIAFALGGITDTPANLIRRSKRRDDTKTHIIPEEKAILEKTLPGKIALCFEDMVCSGRSLYYVMKEAKDLGAKEVVGAAPYQNNGWDVTNELRVIKREGEVYGGLNLFTLR